MASNPAWLLALTLCLQAFISFGQTTPNTGAGHPAPGGAQAAVASEPATPQFNWLNLYDLSSYKEEWTATIQVQDLAADLPKVLEDFKTQGVSPTLPVQNFAYSKIAHTQQLSFRLSKPQADAALLAVKQDKFFVLGLRQMPAPGNAPQAELEAKINALMAERKAHHAAFSKMPAVSSLVEQILSRLVMVKEVQERAQAVVLLNLTVAGKS